MSTNDYRSDAWWVMGKKELNKIPEGSNTQAIMGVMFSDFHSCGIPCPQLTVTEEEVIMEWPEQNRKAVIGPGEEGVGNMLLPELASGSLTPFFPDQLEEFKRWFHSTESPPQPTPEPPSATHLPKNRKKGLSSPDGFMDMMNTMFKTFKMDEMFEDDGRVGQEGPETVPLDAMGQFMMTIFLGFMSCLAWAVQRMSSRVHIRATIKGLLQETIRDVKEGYWNDIFSSPDRWIHNLSPRLHRVVDVLFCGANFSIRHKLMTTALLMFSLGYGFGSS
jgi:hypothetical protein